MIHCCLVKQQLISFRNDYTLTWVSSTGGESASYLITDARLSLPRSCSGEDRPLHCTGYPTARRAACTQGYQFQQDRASACASSRCCLPLYTPHPLSLFSPPPSSSVLSPPHTPTSSSGIKARLRTAVYFANQLAFSAYHFLWTCSSKSLFLQWTERSLLDQSLFLPKQHNWYICLTRGNASKA